MPNNSLSVNVVLLNCYAPPPPPPKPPKKTPTPFCWRGKKNIVIKYKIFL